MGRILGIDLGTTNSVVSVMDGKTIKVIKQENGDDLLPSIVAINKKTNEIRVGSPAANLTLDDEWEVIKSVKTSMGQKVITNKETGEEVNIKTKNGKKFRPEEISALILKELKRIAEISEGETFDSAMITVPAYFKDAERTATKTAGEIAGLIVERVVNEPTAAAIDYGYGANKKREGKMLVYDFGGGTIDISIIEILDDQTYEVIATGGNNRLGGDDLDKVLADYIEDIFHQDNPSKTIVELFPSFKSIIFNEAIRVKKELSFNDKVNISIPMIGMGQNGPIGISKEITVEEFNELILPFIEETMTITKDVLRDSGFIANDLDEILLVGGSTRIPLVREMLSKTLGRQASRLVDPDEAVSRGAAIQGAHVSGDLNDILLLDVTSQDLGIELIGDEFALLISKNTTVPTIKSKNYSNAHDYQDSAAIRVLEGDQYSFASQNTLLGEFHIPLTPKPAGECQIDVEFRLDANNLLYVQATDLSTGVTRNIEINRKNSMSNAQINKSKELLEDM